MTATRSSSVPGAQQASTTRYLGLSLALISLTQLLIVLNGSIVTIALG